MDRRLIVPLGGLAACLGSSLISALAGQLTMGSSLDRRRCSSIMYRALDGAFAMFEQQRTTKRTMAALLEKMLATLVLR